MPKAIKPRRAKEKRITPNRLYAADEGKEIYRKVDLTATDTQIRNSKKPPLFINAQKILFSDSAVRRDGVGEGTFSPIDNPHSDSISNESTGQLALWYRLPSDPDVDHPQEGSSFLLWSYLKHPSKKGRRGRKDNPPLDHRRLGQEPYIATIESCTEGKRRTGAVLIKLTRQ